MMGSNRERLRASLVGALLACPLALAATEGDYEIFDEVAVESVVPTKFLHSAHYSIAARVRADENFYNFVVTTDTATYNITSLTMLRIRLHEIVTVAELEPQLTASKNRLERSPGGRYGVESERVLDIFTDPISTATTLLGNIEYNVEKTFSGADADAVPKLGGSSAHDLDPGPHKRSAAAQLGVDVYSSNPQLQQLLNAVAQARSAGKVQSSISPLIRNIYAPAPFGSGVLNQRLDSHLKNQSSADLRTEIRGSLRDLEVPDAISIAFLTHPAYTPRTRLYLTTYATLLKPVRHIERLFSAATTAVTEVDALAYVSYARMLAYYQLQTGTLTEFITSSRFPTLASSDRNAVLALPLDYLAWSESVEKAATALRTIREEQGLERFVVLLAGTPSAVTERELARRKVELRPAYSY